MSISSLSSYFGSQIIDQHLFHYLVVRNDHVRAWPALENPHWVLFLPGVSLCEKSHRIRRRFCECANRKVPHRTASGLPRPPQRDPAANEKLTHTVFAVEPGFLKVHDIHSLPSRGFKGKSKFLLRLPCRTSPFFFLIDT